MNCVMAWNTYALESALAKRRGLLIPRERQRVCARRLRRRRSDHIMQLTATRQELEAICFATVILAPPICCG